MEETAVGGLLELETAMADARGEDRPLPAPTGVRRRAGEATGQWRRLHGRKTEAETLDRLLINVRGGESQVLVLRGAAGIGKTALLERLLANASGCRIARIAGIENEMELAFAGLHQLCSPFIGQVGRLPAPQREALAIAFGLSTGEPPDRMLVGLAVLSLLADVAEEQPLVCLVDDAQWLDRVSAQTLAFVARRLLAERVALVFAIREPNDGHALEGLNELAIGGLGPKEAGALLDSVMMGPVDASVRERIVDETGGNPLALLELPRGLTPAELAGGFGLPATVPLTSRIEEGFVRRIQSLPVDTQRLLLTAAVEPVGDAALLWSAAKRLEISPDAVAPAVAADLLEIGANVRFRHPLVRSAAYGSATALARQQVHHALAEVTDAELDPDRRAWHRAHAASEPDEAVATELEESASRAQTRGGLAAAAAFLERAVELTLDPKRRAQRGLAAAQAKHEAGAPDAALVLLTATETGSLGELQRVRSELLRAQIAFASNHGRDATPLLLRAAQKLEPLDLVAARDTYLEAFSAAMFVGRLAGDVDVKDVARAARAAAPSQRPSKGDMLLDGRAVLFTDGYRASLPLLKRALEEFCAEDVSVSEGLRWLWLALLTAADLWDDESWHAVSTRHIEIVREAGAIRQLPLALNSRIFVHLFAGELSDAAALVEEAQAVKQATGGSFAPYGALGLAAWRGRRDEADALIESISSEVLARGEGLGVTLAYWADAVTSNGLGQYERALIAAEKAYEYLPELGFAKWSLVELVEAAARSDMKERALSGIEQLAEITSASCSEWALGIEARCRALVSERDAADGLYREAIERLSRTRVRVELARAHLLYGEWLRRESRRVDAREQLRLAHAMFTNMGAEAFGERSRRELLATGETVRKRTPETRDDLTAQETQIASLAAEGHTNPEIGAQLFISPRTVEWHLRKVFAKLEISSRKELRLALPNDRYANQAA
jgi:DNA-binding CsgD family transcriptional regulator/tetratricopeptide (TPR) repeat protein